MSTISMVTGANRGLGRNTAISIARHGGDVIVAYPGNKQQSDAVVAEIQALGREAVANQLYMANCGSFMDFTATARAILREKWGRESLDHLINNSGHGEFALIWETTDMLFDGLFVVHV